MVTEIKYVVLLLFISMLASESIRNADGENTFFNQRLFAIFTNHSSDTGKNPSNSNDNDSGEIQEKGEKPVPCFFEFLMRATDRFPHDKWKPFKPPYAKVLKEQLSDESFPCQLCRNDVFMPDLKYYIYTLEKIVI